MSDAPVPPPPPPPAAPAPAAATGEDKTAAILAYITLLGFIIAIILNSQKKTKLGAYHLRQALGLIVAGFVVGIGVAILATILAFIPILGWILGILLWLTVVFGSITLVVMGIIAAVNGQMKPLPLVGPLFEKWFGTAFE